MESHNTSSHNPQLPPIFDKNKNSVKEIVKFIILALVIVVPIRLWIAQPFIVSGASMDPTFKSGQYLIVDQLTYHISAPKREDVIIFRYPRDPSTFFIKRIIGLPGETVTVKNGEISVTSKGNPQPTVIPDPHIVPEHRTADNYTITLADDEYFVLGDNRPESSDSRVWGPLERKYIIGRPFLSLFPFNKISIFPGE